MPLWSEILGEIYETTRSGPPDFDGIRRKYLSELNRYTRRDVILYASGWLQKQEAPPNFTSINDEDIHAFMEVTSSLRGLRLDLILHSP